MEIWCFLSARPHVKYTKGASEKLSHRTFKSFYKNGILHTRATMLAGNLEGFKGAAVKDFTPMAEKKFFNFSQYLLLHPEFDFVFCGDNGQGDAKAGAMILAAFPGRIKAVFIHRVIPKTKTFAYNDSPEWKQITFFETYIGAALDAYKQELIHKNGVKRIIVSALKGFEGVKWESDSQLKVSQQQFNAELERVKKELNFEDKDFSGDGQL